jgi:hypothetical protein
LPEASILPGSLQSLITPTLWGIKRYTLYVDRLKLVRMLTREEARQLVLNRLKYRHEGPDYLVEEQRTVERPFGWLFFVAVSGSSATAQGETVSHRLIIVNKNVEQVIESSIDYTPQRFIEIYETLLAKSQARREDWCLTMSFPLPWKHFGRQRLAKKAKKMGLYEIK